MSTECQPRSFLLPAEGPFPNNPRLPLMIYPGTFLPFDSDPAADIEARFNANDWPAERMV